MSSPTTRTYGVLYLIRCDQNGLHKIGITNNWPKRRRQLRVGETTTQVHVVRVNKAEQLERYLHRRFSAKRLPQSEWFTLDSEDLVFVRSVFLKAGSDYKAGGHKSPEVEPPAPPPPRPPPGLAPPLLPPPAVRQHIVPTHARAHVLPYAPTDTQTHECQCAHTKRILAPSRTHTKHN